MIGLSSITDAAQTVYAAMLPTAQISWPVLSKQIGAEVWVKHENHTPIGAFKIRGGLNYMFNLRAGSPEAIGVIAATRGNHGQSIALSAKKYGLKCSIVVPHENSQEKNEAMRALGADLIEHGRDFQEALEHARVLSHEHKFHFVESFHDWLVEGVATYALELFQNVSDIDVLYVPIGLGSGICGAIATRNALGLKTEIVGVTAAEAPAYALSFDKKYPIRTESANTMADGLACRAPNEKALDMIVEGASRVITVSEDEICQAIRLMYTATHNLAEGAGAAALAGLWKERGRLRGKKVAVVLSGSNIDKETFFNALISQGKSAQK